jgi:glutaredoxin
MRTVLAAALCLASFAASAQIYRWTDAQGRVHVTDTPPPASAKGARKIGEAAPEGAGPAGTQQPYALQQAQARYPVTLYTTPGCDACTQARKLLNARGLPFSETSITENQQLEKLKEISGGTSVPVIVVGSTVQRGFEPGLYERMLDAAGYPKAGILPPRQQKAPAPAVQPAPEVKPAPEPERPTGPYAPEAATEKSTQN